MSKQHTESHHKAVATSAMRGIAALAAVRAVLQSRDTVRTDTETIPETLQNYIESGQRGKQRTFRYTGPPTRETPVTSPAEAETELRLCCGECHVNAPDWHGLSDRRLGWRMKPTTARIVMNTPAGTGVQLLYRLRQDAMRAGVLEYTVQYMDEGHWLDWEPSEQPWKRPLDMAVLMLQTTHQHLEQVIHEVRNRAVRVPAATDLDQPPVHGLKAGLRLLCALYVADNWTSRTWRHRPPDTLLRSIGLELSADQPTATLSGRTDQLADKALTSPGTVRRLLDALCREDIRVRRLGWTTMTMPPAGTIRPDQAMIFTKHYPLVCRIAMNGRLTDPRPLGAPPEGHPLRWPYPQEDEGAELYQEAANWAAARTALSG